MRDRSVNGGLLRNLRERQGMRRHELAKRSGVSTSWIKYIENNNRQPSDEAAYALALALEVEIDAFTSLTSGGKGDAA